MNKVKLRLLYNESIIPKKSHNTDACYDVVATSKTIYGDGRIQYGLGFSLELPENTQLDIRSRSSIHKTGLILSNGIGTGDEGYTGEYSVIFYHVIKSLQPYEIGDRVAQIQLKSREDIEFILVDELIKTERNDGGFGSTGK
jgi:dUTP pyrophosphatase